MPIHPDWQPLYQSFIDQYGEEEGESNFHAYCKKNNIDYTQPKPKKKSFSWIGDISAHPKENLIKGKAIHPIKTFHPEEWPEVREYLEGEEPLSIAWIYQVNGIQGICRVGKAPRCCRKKGILLVLKW